MIDWHCHLLSGLDDGASDIDESVAMGRSLHAAGYREVYCTPHSIRGVFEASNEEVLVRRAETQAAFDNAGVGIRLQSGREYYLDEYFLDALADPMPLGESRSLLIELPPRLASEAIVKQTLFRVVSAGFTPVIAHPERSPLLSVSRSVGRGGSELFSRLLGTGRSKGPTTFTPSGLLAYLMELGCCFQGNIGSMGGYYGERVRQQAEAMREMGLYDRMGSDLHSLHHAETVLGNVTGGCGPVGR